MEIAYGLCNAGKFIYIEDKVSVAFHGGLKMFADAGGHWDMISETVGLLATFGVKDKSVYCFIDCDGMQGYTPETSAVATISCVDGGFGDVDDFGVIEIDFVLVINGFVCCIGKLAATEEGLVEVGHYVHCISCCMDFEDELCLCCGCAGGTCGQHESFGGPDVCV